VCVRAAHVGLADQRPGERGRPQIAIDGRRDQPDGGPSLFPLHTSDEIIGERLDLGVTLEAVGFRARAFPARHRLEQTDAPAVLRLAGQLAGAQDGGRARTIDELSTRTPLRRPSDPPRIEDGRLRSVEPPEAVRAAPPEVIEDVGPLDEEGALLLEEGLESGEVDDGGIDFYLAEVRVHGAVERQVARHPIFQIHSAGAEQPGAVVEGIPGRGGRDVLGAARSIRKQLQCAMRRDAVEAVEMPHARRQPAFGLRHVDEPRALVLSLDIPLGVDAERVVIGGREPELRERDPHFKRPPAFVGGDRGFPDRIPRLVHRGVVVNR
jgi:hypothetical protein